MASKLTAEQVEKLGTPDAPEVDHRREGQEAGYPDQRWDGERRAWYHLDARGQRVYHECPEGYRYDDHGATVTKK